MKWRWRKGWRWIWQWGKLLLLTAVFLLLAAPEWPAFGDEAYQLRAIVGLKQFDFLVWELNAVAAKAEAILGRGQRYLEEDARQQIVLDYLALTGEARQLERELNALYSDPDLADTAATAAPVQAKLTQTRADLQTIQPTAEAILQDQVAALLAEAGFAKLGPTWPPVWMHMTPLPTILIVSPRDQIDRLYGIPLVHGLTTPQMAALETAVFQQLDLSALVVPIGGLGVYPAMIMETGNINWLADVVAHEWSHHWMAPYPITLYYGSDAQVRTMNETVASIVGGEIGPQVIERYYPQFVPPPAPETAVAPPLTPADPPPFGFRAEMAATRVRVDELLATGEIEAAEQYMEERRQLFVANGYNIRKLNQAYFAFYGAYADQPGATGGDPVGPMVLDIRGQSDSLVEFMRLMVGVGSFAELEELHEAVMSND